MKSTSWVKPCNINQKTIRLDYLNKFKDLIIPGDIYQFGVYSGVSIDNILSVYKVFGSRYVWGFDSFEGLPIEKKETIRFQEWMAGEFSSCDYFDVSNPYDAAEILTRQLLGKYPDFPIEMIVGYFSKTLNSENCPVDKMKPASYIDIDVDLYTSTVELWEFMINNKLVQEGTLVYYDDWKGFEYGEGRAHLEMVKKYNMGFKLLIGDAELLFRVEKL